MAVTQPPATIGPDGDGRVDGSRRLVRLPAKIAAVLVALAASALIGYGLGRHTSSDHVLVGQAYHSSTQGTVIVGGWAYGFFIGPNVVDWYDAHGGSHSGGIPPCLQHPGESWIRFGYSTAVGPEGQSSWRVVDWVQCWHHP